MPYEVIEHAGEGVLEFIAYGHIALAEAEQGRTQALELTQENGFRLVLGNGVQVQGILGGKTLEIFQYGVSSAALAFPIGTRFAVAIPQESPARRDAEFLITVAINRGMRIATFGERDLAWNYLSKS